MAEFIHGETCDAFSAHEFQATTLVEPISNTHTCTFSCHSVWTRHKRASNSSNIKLVFNLWYLGYI